MDGLKKLLIGNKLNHLTTVRILTKYNREKVQSKAKLLTANVFEVLLGEDRRMSLIAGEEKSRAMDSQELINSLETLYQSPEETWPPSDERNRYVLSLSGFVKRSCREIWEVTDQRISTGLEFLSRIRNDLF